MPHKHTTSPPPLSAMTVARSLCKTAQQCIHLQGLWWRLTDAAPAPLHHAAAMSGRAARADGCGVCRQASPILTPSVNRSIDQVTNSSIARSRQGHRPSVRPLTLQAPAGPAAPPAEPPLLLLPTSAAPRHARLAADADAAVGSGGMRLGGPTPSPFTKHPTHRRRTG